jgi:hypothetical protein
VFKTIGKHVPPAPGVKSPALWGTEAHLGILFGPQATVDAKRRHFNFRYKSREHFLEIFRTYYGPVLKAFGAIDAGKQQSLTADMLGLMDQFNVAKDGTLVIPSEYLETVIIRRG